jgi:hypothetical protein
LYGSETWSLTNAALARLEGFNIRAVYKMAKTYHPRRRTNGVWEYPSSKDVLQECGLRTFAEYIRKRRDTLAIYVVMAYSQGVPTGRMMERIDAKTMVVG